MLIIVTIVSLLLDISLTIALSIVTATVIDNNQKIDASVKNVNCLTYVVNEHSTVNHLTISVLDQRISALAKSVSAQANASSAVERHRAQAQYLADIARINKIVIPPLTAFRANC